MRRLHLSNDQWKNLVSCLLLACGTALVFLGMRVLFESYFGQTAGARDFAPAPQTQPVSLPLAPRRGDTVAKLSIPRLGARFYVFEGDDDAELRRGPGHLADSAMPGPRGNCVIAGHRDTHFRVLKDIRKDDDILVQTDTGQYLYRVNSTQIVSPSDTRALKPTRAPVLNLITCYPFFFVGSAPKRFVVQARLAGQVEISKMRNAR
uniref:Sortase family protein n=1 Tax=Solibacter usitatus (strain Ellin6076) TaxID=234267 RepID=Q01VI9_SOLUE